jgi:LysM repeat protein/lysophospholipase L1-like esterase
MNRLLCILFLFSCPLWAQVDSPGVETDSIAIADVDEMAMDSVLTDTVELVGPNAITNPQVMHRLFEKLYQMEQQGKGQVNIVHIGDSHIQADLFTNCIRKGLQLQYGNAGAGFSFPHQLAKTNGSYNTRYKSNASWNSRRVIYAAEPGMEVGLSGIALETHENFAIELNIKDGSYNFNTIKIITPRNEEAFDLATSSKTVVMESTVPKTIKHKIKSGEVLGSIARKYGVTVGELKRANGLKGDNIRAGKTLKIPTNQKEKQEIKRSEFIPLVLQADSLSHYYHNESPLDKIYLLPHGTRKEYSLSGLVLENDAPGILYHSIGVNGAKAGDYNRFPLFFEQLPSLKPDLVVISLGTNESFDKMAGDVFLFHLNQFIANVRAQCPDAAILVTTPPPSLFKRKYPNTFAASYAKGIATQETDKGYATWDMYSEMGGLYSVPRNAKKGYISTDRVHYTKDGYEKQGKLFTEAFIKAYENFKTNRK